MPGIKLLADGVFDLAVNCGATRLRSLLTILAVLLRHNPIDAGPTNSEPRGDLGRRHSGPL